MTPTLDAALTVVAVVLITAGVAFLAVSAAGLVRFPDFYTRAQAAAKSETLGILLIIGGLIALEGFETATLRLLLLLAVAAFANPTAIHVLARAARRTGLEPWRGEPS